MAAQSRLTSPIPGEQRCVATANGNSVILDLEQAHYASIVVGMSVKRGLPPGLPPSPWPPSTRKPASET